MKAIILFFLSFFFHCDWWDSDRIGESDKGLSPTKVEEMKR